MSRLAGALRDDTAEVLQVLIRYLEGCHYGDLEKLKSVVATPSNRNRSASTAHPVLRAPASPSPADQGEPFGYEILNIDVEGDQAVAMLSRTPQPDFKRRVALVRAEGLWYVDAACFCDGACGL